MRILSLSLLIVAMTVFTGCNRTIEGRLPTYKVVGTIKYAGKPLENADIILQFAQHDKASFARTNSAGEFSLGTYEANDGALAGEALITVTKWEQLPMSNALVAGDPGYDPSKAYVAEKEPKLLVPQKYTNFKTSGLKVIIEPSKTNPPLNLELND